jgi:6-pyruvoyl-tetrahydropterin synthase
MYTVEIRDHIMIAHSLKGDIFGPAQNMHGATFVVDAVFISKKLDENNIVIDIGVAHQKLKEVLKPLNYKNLDEMPEFKDKITTTEFLAKYIHDRLKEKTASLFEGRIQIILGESHVAKASYSGEDENGL